jgi:hypothetical protein
MRLNAVVVVGFLVAGCGSRSLVGPGPGTKTGPGAGTGAGTGTGTGDMSVAADLAVTRDLAPRINTGPYDLAWTGCAGTSLANTCVEKFFQQFAACFAPAGSCSGSGLTSENHCAWDSGALYAEDELPIPPYGVLAKRWLMGNKTCMSWFPVDNGEVYCLGDDANCFNGDMATASPNGLFCHGNSCTCPDGTYVKNVNLDECQPLAELVYDPELKLCPHSYRGGNPCY